MSFRGLGTLQKVSAEIQANNLCNLWIKNALIRGAQALAAPQALGAALAKSAASTAGQALAAGQVRDRSPQKVKMPERSPNILGDIILFVHII